MTARERKLMWGFGVALALFAGLFLSTAGMRWAKDLFAENQRLEERVDELKSLVADRGAWQERDSWLDDKVPYFASRQEASAALLEAVESVEQAGAGAVVLKSRQLTEAEGSTSGEDESGNDYFEASAVKLELEAPEAALYQWIHRLHQPESFRGITALTLERGSEGSLRAELELTQFYLQ